MITASAIALGSDDYATAGEHLTEYADDVERAKQIGEQLSMILRDRVASGGHSMISTSTTLDIDAAAA